MRTFFGSENLTLSSSAVALGDFDAIHIGHREIIGDSVDYARKNGAASVVYMFASRPNKNFPDINTLEKRLEILESLGVDFCVVEEFTEEYKNISCESFVKDYLEKRLHAKAVFVGFNYRFGKNAAGDTDMLRELCKGKIEVFEKACVKVRDIPVSSTAIRKMVEKGEVKAAEEFLGRYFSICGTVVHGKQIGRTIGFPTANIKRPKSSLLPKSGVYISRTKVENEHYYSITNIGTKPTVCDMTNNIETAIGNFSGDIYGREIEVEFCDYIREIRKFESLDALKAQLRSDMSRAKDFFKARNLDKNC